MNDRDPATTELIRATREFLPNEFEMRLSIEKHGSWIELKDHEDGKVIASITVGQDPDTPFADQWFLLVNRAREMAGLEPADWRSNT